MLEYYKHVDDSIPASKRHIWPLIVRPVQKQNAERWKRELTHGQRLCFEKRAGNLLHELGYEVLPGDPSGAYFEEVKSLVGNARRALTRRITSVRLRDNAV